MKYSFEQASTGTEYKSNSIIKLFENLVALKDIGLRHDFALQS